MDVATEVRKVCNVEIEYRHACRKGKREVDRPYRSTGANQSRKQNFALRRVFGIKAQLIMDTSDLDSL